MGSLSASWPAKQCGVAGPVVFDPEQGKRANKTIDIGQNGASLSANIYGRVLQLGAYHPRHGFIVAASYEQFDGTKYYDPVYVRDYRKRMLQLANDENEGFGLCIENLGTRSAVDLSAMDTASFSFDTDNGASVRYVVSVDQKGRLHQRAHIINTTREEIRIAYAVNLRVSVHRASYGQLTEGGPIPLPDCENALEVRSQEGCFTIRNKFLGARLTGQLAIDNAAVPLAGLTDTTQAGLLTNTPTTYQSIVVAPNSTRTIELTLHLATGLKDNFDCHPEQLCFNLESLTSESSWKNPGTFETYIIRRNVDYILGNCAIPVSESEVALITDHVALPLGWNRDNYWQWRLLLTTRRKLASLVSPEACTQYKVILDRTLKGHLEWVFAKAERPHKFWHRSYLITGKPKDGPVFQLDQQCYPILELCDYYSEYPNEREFVGKILSSQVVTEVLDHITSRRDKTNGLFPTDETPGDDEVVYPFHFSSHVLLWYALSRLADLLLLVPTPLGGLADRVRPLADEIRMQTMQHFLISGRSAGESNKLAYLVDGYGEYEFYHDGNDIPTAFAASWGFFSTKRELEAWHNTMNYALSEENRLGYSSGGPFAGLGSVHSRGPWPLGYFQEMIFADIRGDKQMKADVMRRIIGAMQWDGTFGEAVDLKTGETTSKAWFSWPGAMIATELIDSQPCAGTEE